MGVEEQQATYPEHEKLMAVKDESQAIGEFIDFGPYTLCAWREAGDNGEPKYVWNEKRSRSPRRDRPHPSGTDYINDWADANPGYESWGAEFVPVSKSIPALLADWFGIDQDKIEAEKRAMLDALRELSA